MKRLLLSLILFFPTALAAQELHTFSNGEVADAEKINENFEALKSEMSAAQSSSPRMAWATTSGEVNGYWFQENDYPYIALKLPNDSAVYLSPFDPREPEEEDRETPNAYYLDTDCQGVAYVEGQSAFWQMMLVVGNSEYFLKRTVKRSNDAEDLVSRSYFMNWEGVRQCQNSETTIDSTFWETEQTTLLMSDLNKPHTLIWLD